MASGRRGDPKNYGRHHLLRPTCNNFDTFMTRIRGPHEARLEIEIVFSGTLFLASLHASTWPLAYFTYTYVSFSLIETNPLCFTISVLVPVISIRKHTIFSKLIIIRINVSVSVH